MSAAPVVPDRDRIMMFEALICHLRRRFRLLATAAGDPERKAEVARLGLKLSELAYLAEQSGISRRDAALAPLLGAWVVARFDALEAQLCPPSPLPLQFPLAPAACSLPA